jgi:hypothetical protein
MKLPLLYYRIFRYEYRPSWAFYLPVLPYWLYLSVRARSLSFFTATNPGIELGGFFGESKTDILAKIPGEFLPKHVVVDASVTDWNVLIEQSGLLFPVIAKPDVGERGTAVAKLHAVEELEAYAMRAAGSFLLQEFVTYEEEFGVFYSCLPQESKGKITSLTRKGFLSVTGDGKSTVAELMKRSVRARFQLKRFRKEQPEILKQVPNAGQTLLLEPIGNHCRGTEFINANDLVTERLTEKFDRIAENIEGFYYGRFDIKVRSVADLQKGETIRILELNGVSSEPGHIYDVRMSLFKAYYDLTRHWKRMKEIAVLNRKEGFVPVGFGEIWKVYWRHVLS